MTNQLATAAQRRTSLTPESRSLGEQPDEKSPGFIQSLLHDKEARWQFLTSDPAAQQPAATH